MSSQDEIESARMGRSAMLGLLTGIVGLILSCVWSCVLFYITLHTGFSFWLCSSFTVPAFIMVSGIYRFIMNIWEQEEAEVRARYGFS